MADDSRYPKLYAKRPGADEPAGPRLDPAGASAEPPRDAVGTVLRRTREAYGQDLRQVSESLRIRYAYLDAIERSAFEELPGPTYAIGFVRGYSQYLGLDDDDIVRRFKEESQGLKRDQELHFPAPVNEGKLPGGKILLISALLIAAAYGAWTYLSDDSRSIADLVPEVPQSLQDLVGTEAPRVDPDTPQVADTGDPAPASGESPTPSSGGESDPAAAEPRNDASGEGGDPAGASDAQTAASDPNAPADRNAAADSNAAADADDPDGASGSQDAQAVAAGDDDATSGGSEIPAVPTAEQPAGDGADTGAPAVPEAQAAPDANGAAADAATDRAQSDTTQPETTEPETTEPSATAADGPEGADEGPPAVPELAQDDSGIPTAPGTTQTASTQPEGRSFGADAANSRVTLRATAKSWVQVRGPDDSLVLTRMLRPGDVYRVPDRPGLTLHTGNAGGLEVLVDGRLLGNLGNAGQVRRGILLEPGALGGS